MSLLFGRRLGTQIGTLGDRLGAPEARELFRVMFAGYEATGANASLKAGRANFSQGFHPDNYAAAATLRKALGLVDPDEERRDENALATDEIILVGGTNSSVETMIAWEASGPSMDRLSRPEERGEQPIIPLRWFGSGDRNDPAIVESGPVGWSMEGEGGDDDYVSTVNWALWDTCESTDDRKRQFAERGSLQRDRFGKQVSVLATNHLFITRMPNFISPRFWASGSNERPFMTVFQGVHGPGTRAVELLLTGRGLPALEAAERALRAVGNPDSYQLLFQVFGLGREKDYRGGLFHAFHEIAFLDLHVLGDSHEMYLRAHNVAMQRLRQPEPWRA